MTVVPLPRPAFPLPLPRSPITLLPLSLLLVLLLAAIQPLVVFIAPVLPSTTTPALPYARTDSNVFIENWGQFDPAFVAILIGQDARLAVGHDGRLHLHVDGAAPLTFTAAGVTTTPDVSLHGPLATTISFLTGNDPNQHVNVPVWEVARLALTPGVTLELTVIDGRLRLCARTADPTLLNRVQMQVSGGEVIGMVDGELEVQAGAHRLRLPLLEAVTPAGIPHQQTFSPAIAPDGVVRAPVGIPEGIGITGQATPTQTSAAMLLGASTFVGGAAGSGEDTATAMVIDGQGAVYVAGNTGSADFPTTLGAYDRSLNGGDRGDAFVSRLSGDLRNLLAGTFLGGSDWDEANDLALDAQGNVYVAGETSSTDFPTTLGAYDRTYNGGSSDVFVSRLSGDLNSLLASTFLGGSAWDSATALVLDGQGNVYVAGETGSADFPTMAGAYDGSYNSGDRDAFASKLSGDLGSLLTSTFLGGSDWDVATALALDGQGTVYVAGYTSSTNFPTTLGAYDRTYNGGSSDAFAGRLSGDLGSLLTSTFLGGNDSEYALSLALDGQGAVYVMGETGSTIFPTTAGAYDRVYNGGYRDAFVSRLSSNLGSLLASTFLGGSGWDVAIALTLDGQGTVYVAGYTSSTNFPTTLGAYDGSYNGGDRDAFASKLSGDLGSLLTSTFLGGMFGNGNDVANSLAISSQDTVYVAGWTGSANFPTTAGAYDGVFNRGFRDAFVSRLSSDLGSLLASTFLGGSDWDVATALVLDGQGNVYVAGETWSANFPTTAGAYDRTYNGGARDAFVSKLSGNLGSLLASTFLGGSDWDSATALALDGQGNVYVAGDTYSTDFPTTAGVYDRAYNGGGSDTFVSRLSGDLGGLLAGSFLGGSLPDSATALALDGQGNVYVAGWTDSANFPTTAGSYDGSFNGSDGFVSKLSGELRSLVASTFLGGSIDESATALTLDGQGNVYVAGETSSTDFPTTLGAHDRTYNGGGSDVFVSRLSGDLGSQLASTFLGGSDWDSATALVLDGQGSVYVAGETGSADFPTMAGAYDGSYNGSGDTFVSRLSGNLGGLLASTFLGGSAWDSATALALDGQGTVYVAGYTESNNFPITAGAYGGVYNGDRDAFVSKLVFAFTKTSSAVSTTNQSINLTLQWQSAGATVHHYRYCLDTNPGCTPTTNVGANTSVTVAGITPNTTYYWQVRACADSDCAVFIDANNGQHWSLKTSFMIYLTFAAR